MNKLILLAAVGLCFGNIYAKSPKKNKAEEGFIFTTVKENPITSIKTRTSRVRAGLSPALVSWSLNYFVQEKENSTCLKCSSYTKQWKTVP